MATLSTGARWLKRGDTSDPEDHRMTHRLRVALGFLGTVGITSSVVHDAPQPYPGNTGCPKHPDNRGRGLYDPGYCSDRCKTVWPEWVTDDMFNDAFAAASALQNLRGRASQAQINVARASRP